MSSRKLRILYYVESLGLGGANQTTLTVAREMKARGHHVVFASDGGPLLGRLTEKSIPHVPVRTDARHPSWSAAATLVRAVRQHAVDLVCPNGFDCTLDAIPCGLLTGAPLLPTYGGLVTPPYPHPWLPRVNVFSRELAADLISHHRWNPSTFRNLIARIDGERFRPGVDAGPFRRELGIDREAPLVLMVCRQDSTKLRGVMVLLDAVTEIRNALPEARIVILGDGDRRERILDRIRRIHEASGEPFVIAPGSTTNTPAAFASADVVVANGARSALEAMACGRPVVSVGPNGFDGVFSPETIEGFRRFNYDKGRLAGNPLGDHRSLARAVVRILRDSGLRRELGEFCEDYARGHLIIQTTAADYENLYRETIADPWGSGGGRLRVLVDWVAVLARFYAHRLGRRWASRAGKGAVPITERLIPPPPGVDPDWKVGLADESDR
jgi:glycosyltransferase involved in cell wall biosynthesis